MRVRTERPGVLPGSAFFLLANGRGRGGMRRRGGVTLYGERKRFRADDAAAVKRWQFMAEVGDPVPEGVTLDTSVAHPARVYDYWLGGKDNFAADREAADQVIAANPTVLPGVRANRAFLGRAVRYLAAEAGIRQFLDLGTGLPTAQNTHQVAQEIAPDSRIVYVDNDPDRARLCPGAADQRTRGGHRLRAVRHQGHREG